MKKQQLIDAAKKLVIDGEEDDVLYALAQVATNALSQRDCELWHEGRMSNQTRSLVAAAQELAGGPTAVCVWGSRTGYEPVSVNIG